MQLQKQQPALTPRYLSLFKYNAEGRKGLMKEKAEIFFFFFFFFFFFKQHGKPL